MQRFGTERARLREVHQTHARVTYVAMTGQFLVWIMALAVSLDEKCKVALCKRECFSFML